MAESVIERRAEFDTHVWDHTADVFQATFDIRRDLSADELWVLNSAADSVDDGADVSGLAARLLADLTARPDVLLAVMQVAGLTRNKIITDLKASSAAKHLTIPGKPAGLIRNAGVWKVAGPYLAYKLRKVIEPIAGLDEATRENVFQALNQATYPGWIRQERAKRQGHEAEHRMAVLLFDLGLPFTPSEKAENPLCRDAQINGISFDLVVPNLTSPILVMKSTVQTANIGQFGESKADLEVSEAVRMLESEYGACRRPTLLAMIDGVRFRSNVAGLHGVLSNADEFAQFATIWKVAAISASKLEATLTVALPEGDLVGHQKFIDRWASDAVRFKVLDGKFRSTVDPASTVEAGEALLIAG